MSDVSITVSVSEFGEPLVNREAFLDEGRVVVRIEQGEDVVGMSMNSVTARRFASRLVESAEQAEGIERAREARREDENE